MKLRKAIGLFLSVSMLASAAPQLVWAAPEDTLAASIEAKTETRLDFEGDFNAVKGTSPVKTGSIGFASGKTGQAAVFTTGKNYLDFQDYKAGKKSLAGKSISFAIQSNKPVGEKLDPAILSNKNWDQADKGFVFAYSYGGNNRYKIRLDNGTYDADAAPYARKDYDKTVYTVGIWHDYVLNFAADGKSWSLYKDGQLETTIQTDQFDQNWCDSSSYSLKLGNDGTGKYSKNDTVDYEFLIDDFLITNTLLTEEEISYLHNPPMDESEKLTGSITGETEVPRADVEIIRTYKAEFRRENGMLVTDPSRVTWSISEGDVTIPEGISGGSVVVTVPAGTKQDSFRLTATYSPEGHEAVSTSVDVKLTEAGQFPETAEDKLETRISFEDNVSDEFGANTPQIKGSVTYASGRSGEDKGIVFKKGSGYLDFTNYIEGKTSVGNKSIGFSIRSNKQLGNQTDPAILGNKDWNDGYSKGFMFAYNWSGNNTYKVRLADGTNRIDQANMPHTLYEWHDYVMNFDTVNKKWSLYKDGELVVEKDTSGLADGWQDSNYTMKLGNDGTGAYKGNASVDFECVVDNFIITSELLTADEIKQIHKSYEPVDTGKKTANIAAIGAEKTAAGGYYNLSLYSYGKDLGDVGSVEFDLVYNPDAMRFDRTQFGKTTTITADGEGKAHVVSKNPIANSTIQMYGTTRMAQAVFELEDVDVDTSADLKIENVKFLDASGNEIAGISADIDCVDPVICAKDAFDLNSDGVVGAGDVSLAETEEQKKEIAQNAAIYPYKRAVAITIDGLGRALSEDDAIYNNKGFTKDGTVIPGEGLENVRNNPYSMNLLNNEMATSYTALSMDPPISAQNYCSINHGKIFKQLPSEYQFTNTIAEITHWPDINLVLNGEEPQLPSMEYIVNQQAPNRKIFTYAEWTPITNGIIEPYSGAYVDYESGKYCFDRLADYIKEGKFKNTALTYMQSDVMDHYGHSNGYFTDGYYQELAVYDEFFKTLVDAMKEADVYDDTLLVVNTDHGGHNYWNEPNDKMQGTHSNYNIADDRNTFISVGGQTVEKGAKLSGGSSEDIPGIVLAGLRMEKPASMSDSTVFDTNMFLAQEDLTKNGRNIETVTTQKNDKTLDISLSNVQDGNVINTADMVITYGGGEAPAVTVEEGAKILRNEISDGKLYLTISYDNTPQKIASVPGGGKIEEIMLGTSEGKEIYSDLVTKSPVNDVYRLLGDDTIKGNNESLEQVTGDLELPEALEGTENVTISWTSTDEAAVNPVNGYVQQQANDKEVTLTASISDGTETKEKKFTVTVLARPFDGAALEPSGTLDYSSYEALKEAGILFKNNDKEEYQKEELDKTVAITYGPDYLGLERKIAGTEDNKVDVDIPFNSKTQFAADRYILEFELEQVNGAPMYICTPWYNGLILDWKTNGDIQINRGKKTVSGYKNQKVSFRVVMDYSTLKSDVYMNGKLVYSGDFGYTTEGTIGKPSKLTVNVKGDTKSGAAVGSGAKIYNATVYEAFTGTMAEAIAAADIRNLTNENTNFITQDLCLPTVPAEGTSIIWMSSNQAVLANDGTVTAPQYDTQILLKAAITDDKGNSVQYQYLLTVLGTDGESPSQAGLRIVDENGHEIVTPSGGDTIRAEADQALMEGCESVMLVLAAYRADGALDALQVVYGDGSSGLSTEQITVPDGGTAKAMLWDGKTMKPLA